MQPSRNLRLQAERAARKRLILLMALAIIFLALVLFYLRSKSTPTPADQNQTSSPQTTTKQSIKQNTNEAKALAEAIKTEVDANSEYIIGVSVIDLTDGTKANVQGDHAFRATSTAKMLVACLFLSRVEAGSLHLTDHLGNSTAKYQLQQMINQSNNDSWALFNNLLTSQGEEEYAKKLGLTSYESDSNSFSSNDMATLLAKLYKGELLNKENTQLLLSYMQETNDETLIPAAFVDNDDLKLYHKYGALEDDLHDVAIIDNGKRPFVVAIYTNGKGFYQYDIRAKMMQKITKNVLKVIEAQS